MSRETHTEETKEGWLYRPDLSVCCTTVSVPVCPSHADSNPHLLSLNLPFTSFSFCPGVQYPRGLIYRAVSDLCRQEGGMKLPSFASRSAACSCTSINRRMRPIFRSWGFDKSNWSFSEKKERKEGDGERSWYVWITLRTWQKNQGQGPGRKFWAPDYILTNESRRISDPKLKNVWFQSRFLSLFLWSWGYWKRQWRPIAIVLLSRWT